MPGTLREVLDNGITPRYKISLNGLGMKKGKSRDLSMMLKIGMEMAQYYTVLNYRPQNPQKDLKPRVRKIVAQPGTKPATNFFLLGHSKDKVGKESPPRRVDHE